jgi:glutathione synthase/RimK-type ligase-like ATP-grasp enzyme
MTHRLDADDYFIHCVQKQCADLRLNFFLVEPLWVEAFYEGLSNGRMWPRVLLNMHSEHHQPKEIFHRLVRLAADKGVRVIDPPDRALAAFDKSRLHGRLMTAGLQVPHTVIVPAGGVTNFTLNAADRAALGSPFVIKPAMGYGRRGLVLDAASEADALRSAAEWPDDNYLLQRRIIPTYVDGRPAYWRVYFVFGTVWCSWWNCFTDEYRLVTAAERSRLKLDRLEEIISRIAALTGMEFFSTEIAETAAGDLVIIDYVNDQCHMLSQTADPQKGVPDELVAAIAKRLMEAVDQMIKRP